MRQRLGLAQAIMENPKILILDEPFNGLDKDGVADMRKYLLELKERGKQFLLLLTHQKISKFSVIQFAKWIKVCLQK